jgi:hypothetical protein
MPNEQTQENFASSQGALDRRRKLAASLLERFMTPQTGQMVGNHYVGVNAFQGLTQLAGQYLAQKQLSETDTQQAGLDDRYKSGLVDELKRFSGKTNGTPGDVMSDRQAKDLMRGDIAPVLADGASPDPKGAAIEAYASQFAPIRKLAEAQLAQQGKSALDTKDILSLSGFDPSSRLAAALAGNISGLKPERKEHVVNGQLLVGSPEQGYAVGADARSKFNGVGVIGPDGQVGQIDSSTGEAKFAPRGVNVRVGVDTAQKAGDKFATELSGKRADIIAKSYDTAVSAQSALATLSNAQQDLSGGIKSGITADFALGLAKFGKAFGIDASPEIANTESFRANMARETVNMVKQLGSGSGISNADLAFAEKASGGQLSLDNQSMQRLMNIASVASANKIMDHKALLSKQLGATGALPADISTFEVPLGDFYPPTGTTNKGGRFYYDSRTPYPAQKSKTTGQAVQNSTPLRDGAISLSDWLNR